MELNIPDKISAKLILLWLVCGIFLSCSTSRNIPDNQFMLIKNEVYLDGKKVKNQDVHAYIKQKPNPKSFIFFRKGGEHRVLLNNESTRKSANQLLLYYKNKGYLDASVDTKIEYKGKKATQVYSIDGKEMYKVNKIKIEDNGHPLISEIIKISEEYRLIKEGDDFDFWKLKEEHNRIFQLLKNTGYYKITKDHLSFEADTLGKTNEIDLYYTILDDFAVTDTARVSKKHKRFKFKTIDVYIDVEENTPDKRLVKYEGLNIYFPINEAKYKEKIIRSSIEMEKGNYFSKELVDESYSKLVNLGIFKSVKFNFEESDLADLIPSVNAKIELKSGKRYAITEQVEVEHTSGRYGVSEKVSLWDRNLFRGAEAFQLSFSGTLEKQEVTNESDPTLFNSSKWGIETSLGLPRFLSPIDPDKFLPAKNNARTNISLGYNRLARPDFGRSILNSSYGYAWREGSFKTHQVRLVEISSVFVDEGSDLSGVSGSAFNQQYTDHLITSTNYTYTFNNQDPNKVEDHNLFQFKMEYSGHILNMLTDKFGLGAREEAGEPYRIFNNAFTQYTKLDLDYRYYFEYYNHQTLAIRLFMGAGVAYGNSEAIPFQKQYFVGGSNDLRSFDAYSIGPGSYIGNDTTNYYSADVKFEVNLEYRFNIGGSFRGAFFMEAGNIWDNQEYTDENGDALRPNGTLSMNKFLSDLAIGTGVGLRYDFSFLVFRFDFGYPLYNPSAFQAIYNEEGAEIDRVAVPKSERWTNDLELRNFKLNIGIGYPF
jgi:outer membrane protein assembly factor BamA